MLKIQAKEIIGGDLSATTKMPCKSFNLPAWECRTGSKLAKIPGTVCHGITTMTYSARNLGKLGSCFAFPSRQVKTLTRHFRSTR